jgi:flagellar assembly factor FliW
MAFLNTRDFGEIEYAEESVVEFPLGLPAFESQHRFLLIQPPAMSPLVFLQSIATPSLSFTAVPVSTIDPDYELAVLPEDLQAIGFAAGDGTSVNEQLACFVVVTVPERGSATANLLAPLIINVGARRAVQAVRSDARYSHRHPIGGAPCS